MTHPDDKRALSGSQAGMRFIALMKLYNDGHLPRLQQFIQESFAEPLLSEQDASARTAEWAARREAIGRHKVKQALAVGKHHAAVIVEAEHSDALYYVEIAVEEDYPHRITKCLHAPLQLAD
ncbi:MAG: hypothetical protein SNJ54_08935 [Anaerolineae bacterium]